MFGNFDNHVRFAPIYNFVPMKADPEMVTRLFKWGKDCEAGVNVNLVQVAEYLGEYYPYEEMMAFLNELVNKLIN